MLCYQVGDRVVVRDDLKIGRRYSMYNKTACDNTVIISMIPFRGKTVTISEIAFGEQYRIQELAGVCWTDEMFEGRADEPIPCLDELL